MKVVITGTGGRLGAALARHLRERHRVVAYDRKAMDLREPAQIVDHLEGLEFDVLINCAAVTSLEQCEREPDEAIRVNEAAPELMAQLCRERGARMVHLSTNYVYEGGPPGLRTEESPVEPLSVYARTKLQGELRVLKQAEQNIVARTAWIFGPDRESFVDQIIHRAQTHDYCTAISDVRSSASYSVDLGLQIERLLQNPSAAGIYNLSNAGDCSWLELGQAALDGAASLGWNLRCRTLAGQSVANMENFLAKRPARTAMDLAKLTAATGLPPRPWQEALHDYLRTYYAR
jgi:dTDP-4-dehydrorhamnose reductase